MIVTAAGSSISSACVQITLDLTYCHCFYILLPRCKHRVQCSCWGGPATSSGVRRVVIDTDPATGTGTGTGTGTQHLSRLHSQ